MASKTTRQKLSPPPTSTTSTSPALISRARLWGLRLLAAVAVPITLLLAVEVGLRWIGYGYPTDFLVPVKGRDGISTSNPRFGWRFFPRHLARGPVPLEVEALEPERRQEVLRIFVTGGSAARGTPDSAYSMGRILEILLETSHGDARRIEVHNAAMTAINSHVVLPIVEDCTQHDPDLFVVYLGNNEVVGPFGAGTVFQPLSPSLAAIRAGIGLRQTRLGQLLENGLQALARPTAPARWQGMEMFLERRLAADDPRLEQVYGHFERNLSDVVKTAAKAGARTLLATVATNLADQPPFASLPHRPLAGSELEEWQSRFEDGVAALDGGDAQRARRELQAAAAIDDGRADLHFQIGRAQTGLGDSRAALASFVRARDLDALRFRADTRINRIIRDVAAREAEHGTLLADVDGAFSRGGPPGAELFYEHVHLNFAGNDAVAREIWRTLNASDLLPTVDAAVLPTVDQVAERLVLTAFDRHDLESDILGIVSRPPFTGQPGHAQDLVRRRQDLATRRAGLTAERWQASAARYQRQLERDPDDLELRRRFAVGLSARGQPADALAAWRFLTERLPGVPAWQSAYALALADTDATDAAISELETLLEDWPTSPETHVNLGTVQEKAGRFDQAIDHYRRALELSPDHGPTSYNLGTAMLRSGDTKAAADHFRQLLVRDPGFAAAHHNLGHALEELGDLDGAVASYRRAIAADPSAARAHNSLGLALLAQGLANEAAQAYLAALHAEPDFALAHFNLADLLLENGRAEAAIRHYRQGLSYRPNNLQARVNLAIGLQIGGDINAAIGVFEDALERARAAGSQPHIDEIGRRLAAIPSGLRADGL